MQNHPASLRGLESRCWCMIEGCFVPISLTRMKTHIIHPGHDHCISCGGSDAETPGFNSPKMPAEKAGSPSTVMNARNRRAVRS